MIRSMFACAFALGAIAVSGTAMADDPRDPTMRSADARARDKAIIKRLNQQELARVRARDARYAQGWAEYRKNGGRAQVAEADEARYQRQMAEWRRAVAACNAGHYEYCAR